MFPSHIPQQTWISQAYLHIHVITEDSLCFPPYFAAVKKAVQIQSLPLHTKRLLSPPLASAQESRKPLCKAGDTAGLWRTAAAHGPLKMKMK